MRLQLNFVSNGLRIGLLAALAALALVPSAHAAPAAAGTFVTAVHRTAWISMRLRAAERPPE